MRNFAIKQKKMQFYLLYGKNIGAHYRVVSSFPVILIEFFTIALRHWLSPGSEGRLFLCSGSPAPQP
jgi:hypothetical protein